MKLWQAIKLMSLESTLDIIDSKITEFDNQQVYLEKNEEHKVRNGVLISKFQKKLNQLVDEHAQEPYTFSQNLNEITLPLIEKADYSLLEDAKNVLKEAKATVQCKFDLLKEKQDIYETIYLRNNETEKGDI